MIIKRLVSVPWVGDYQFLLTYVVGREVAPCGFRPLSRGLSIPSAKEEDVAKKFLGFRPLSRGLSIPSGLASHSTLQLTRFRPLSRGLSIPSLVRRVPISCCSVSVPWVGDYQFLLDQSLQGTALSGVSVPWVGDYQFLHPKIALCIGSFVFPSPESGIINSFDQGNSWTQYPQSFRPLSRGLSIPSRRLTRRFRRVSVSVPWVGDYQFLLMYVTLFVSWSIVSVPWVGDYQFLLVNGDAYQREPMFPSPESGIINSFMLVLILLKEVLSFRPLSRGLSIPSVS